MSTQATIRSYYLIIERLRSPYQSTKKELLDYLKDEGLVNSTRTLERRIEEIRTEFHLDIPYSAKTNTYSLSESDMESLDTLLRFLEMNSVTSLFGDSIKGSQDAIKHLSFDTDGSFRGLENLKPILNAIQAQQLITFSYHKFEEDKPKEVKDFCPLLLREYLGRWYACGTFQHSTALFTYGLDRIISLSVSAETFLPTLPDPASKFSSVVGVSVKEPVEIELAFSASQAKYLKTLPLHKSQEIVSETDEEVVFRYLLAPNYELIQRILMWGREVKVLKPASLAEDLKFILSETLKKYTEK
jgi:predicted DNA-binding transcriptional regulator YafY